MTVIKDKKVYKYPSPNSATASDTESLNLGSISASDAESLLDEPVTPNRIRSKLIKVSHVEDLIHVKKHSGKKKLRRYYNKCTLQTLNEEDENENMVAIMENYKGPFARLLDNQEAFDYWQEFVEKSEDEQADIINSLTLRYPNETVIENSKSDVPGRISSRIKRTFKIRKNLSLEIVQLCEEDLINFFKIKPHERYIKIPPTSFERLLIHAIAQYHRLESISVIMDDGIKKSVEVYSNDKNWVPAKCNLVDFIRDLRKS